jgi:hypothetical protein
VSPGTSRAVFRARSLREQLREDYPTLLAFYGPLLGLFGLITALCWHHGIPPSYLLRDPSATLEAPFYVGLFSDIGVLAWCVGATAALIAYAVGRKRGWPREWNAFFLLGGVFTAIMCLDDLFLFHEEIFPVYVFSRKGLIHFHMSEKVVYAAYGVVALTFLVKCRATIRQTDCVFLYLALAFLALSLLVEGGLKKHQIASKEVRDLLEDGSKFLGIMGWAFYFALTSFRALVRGSAGAGPSQHNELPAE